SPDDAISYTDVTTGASGSSPGEAYAGGTDYLHYRYIYAGPDALAIRANEGDAHLGAGPGGGALEATAGNNLLVGGAGSNFLVGGAGADGGHDTFVVDVRSGVTWNTIVNLHAGDQIEVEGFRAGVSTMPFTALDGVAGY